MRRQLAAIALVTLLLLCGAPIARAEPISIALLTTVGISATATAVSLTTFALTVGAGIGLSYLQSAFAKKSAGAQTSTPIGGHSGRIAAGGTVPRACGVGDYMTAGSLAYVNSFGEDGKTPNAFLVYVIALSDLPVAGFKGFWVNGARVTLGAETSNAGYAVPEFTNAAGDHLWVKFYDGTQAEADARLVEMFGGHAERPYTARRIGTGCAYAIITVRVNPELFSGFPQFKFELEGIPLYDRRYDSTAGGDGDQRYDDPGTWLPSANPAVIRWNILRGLRYAGQWQWGGQTITEAQLPNSSWFAAMNECDAMVDLAEGGQEAQFKAGGEINFGTKPIEVLRELNKADNGRLAEIGGIYKTRSGAPGAAVFAFTDRDILSSAPQTFEPIAALDAKINYVAGRYISRTEGWTLKDAPALVDADLEARDGRRHAASADYGFVTSPTQVQRLMRAERDSNRAWRRHALPMPPEAFVLEPLDVVSWNSGRNGYDDKALEIVEVEDLPTFDVGIAIKELDGAAYNWDPNADERTVSEGTITILRPEAQPVVDWYVEPYTFTSGGRARAGILFGWDPDQDDVDGIRVQVQSKATEELQLDTEEGSQVFARGALAVSQNLIGNTQYQGRLQYRPASAREALWTSWRDVTTDDVRVSQEELSAELDSRVRQVVEQFNELSAKVRRIGDNLSAAVNSQVSALRETHGRTVISVGETYGENKAAIEQVAIAYVAADEALAALITALEVEVDDNTAAITNEMIVRATADEAIAADLTTLETVVDGNTASISQEVISRSTADEALASDITDLTATVGSNTAAITNESIARATGDSALSGRLTNLFATGPGGSAETMFRMIAATDAEGALATIALQARAGPSESYTDAGIYIDVMPGFGRIRTLADYHAVQAPGVNGGDPFYLMEISGDVIRMHALVEVQTLKADTVDTEHLKVGSVDINALISGAAGERYHKATNAMTTSSNGQNVVTHNVSIADGTRRVQANLDLGNVSSLGGTIGDGGPGSFYLKFKLDGSTLRTIKYTHNAGTGNNFNGLWMFDQPIQYIYEYPAMSAGTHEFKVELDASGTTTTLTAGDFTISEVRR